jgi:hypothetical protein
MVARLQPSYVAPLFGAIVYFPAIGEEHFTQRRGREIGFLEPRQKSQDRANRGALEEQAQSNAPLAIASDQNRSRALRSNMKE